MKRIHIHVRTSDLGPSIDYYTALFGEAPTKREDDYAKWLLDDPAVNLSLSTHDGARGVDHTGISIETEDDLHAVAERLRAIGAPVQSEQATTCCYAKSNKYWSADPQGARWELFQTFGESDGYGADPEFRKEMEAVAEAQGKPAP